MFFNIPLQFYDSDLSFVKLLNWYGSQYPLSIMKYKF